MSKNFYLGLSVLLNLIAGLFPVTGGYAQGMSTNPPRLYFTAPPNRNETKKLTVMNTGQIPLELGISIGDWDYDSLGNNRLYEAGALKTSATSWIQIYPSSYLVLPPGERKDLDIILTPPANTDSSASVHTAMIFLTQLNPMNSQTVQGANIKVNIRSGTKVYYSSFPENTRNLEITNFKKLSPISQDSTTFLELTTSINGKLWVEGDVRTDLLNMQSGKRTKLPDIRFYALPGDVRLIRMKLPGDLPSGHYTATAQINFGKKNELKVAELEFILNREGRQETGTSD